MRKDDYNADGYLEGVEVVSMDWYDVGSADNLDVLKCLQGTKFVYFTSSKSTLVELAEWIAMNDFHGNPFEGAKVYRHHVGGIVLNYEDVMIVKAD